MAEASGTGGASFAVGVSYTEGSGGRVQLWGPGDTVPRGHVSTPFVLSGLDLSPSGRLLAAVAQGAPRLWDVSDPAAPNPVASWRGPQGPASGVRFLSDSVLLTYGDSRGAYPEDPAARLWDVSRPEAPRQIGTFTLPGQALTVTAVGGGGKLAATAGTARSPGEPAAGTALWDLTDPRSPRRVPLAADLSGAEIAAIDPSGSLVVTRQRQEPANVVTLWRIAGSGASARVPADLGRLPGDRGGWAPAPVFSPDGRLLANLDGDGYIGLTDVSAPAPAGVTELGGVPNETSIMIFSSGAELAAGRADGSVLMWNLTDPRTPAVDRIVPRPRWEQ